MKKIIFLLVIILLPITVNAARGCCSGHGGISHCGSNGKYVCKDGKTSPSCTCTYTYNNDTPSTNNSINNSSDTNNSTNNNTTTTKSKEELKEPEVIENIQVPEKKEEVITEVEQKEESKEEVIEEATKQKENITIKEEANQEESAEELTTGDILTIAALITPGSIAAIAYERKIRKK